LTNRTRSFDLAVVGGGVIGLAVAWRAAQHGMQVVVLERGEPGRGTSHVAAGMIAPVSEARRTEQELLHLGLASAAAYPEFVAELVEATGHDPGYLACGTLAAARDEDDAAALDRELALRHGLGLPVRRLRASEARRLEPALAPTVRLGLEIPDDHAIDPRKLTAALAQAVERAGGQVRKGTEVAAVNIAADRVRGLRLAGGEEVPAAHVVIAAGVWSDGIAGIPTQERVPLRPVKGQILRLHDPAGPGLLTRALRTVGGYVVPRGDGRYVLGATMEERGFDTTVTAGAVFELLRDAIEVLPGIEELVIDELSAGIRPGTPDNSPAIGSSATTGLQWATGHHRHGILLTPITAEAVVAELIGRPVPPVAAAFSPRRFGHIAVGA
jgi:glycine oxidase